MFLKLKFTPNNAGNLTLDVSLILKKKTRLIQYVSGRPKKFTLHFFSSICLYKCLNHLTKS